MLNELLVAERGMRSAGIEIELLHPDVQDTGKKSTLRVHLSKDGTVTDVSVAPADTPLWTLGKGNKERFPFVQPNAPLLNCPTDDLESLGRLKGEQRRTEVVRTCAAASFNSALAEWPGVRSKSGKWSQDPGKFLKALRARHEQLRSLEDTEAAAVPAVIERFVRACEKEGGGAELLRQIVERVRYWVERSPDSGLIATAEVLLLKGGGALYFDIPHGEYPMLAGEQQQRVVVSEALLKSAPIATGAAKCSLSGKNTTLVDGAFPEVVLPIIGKTKLFARFNAVPSNSRYGKLGASSFSAGQETVQRLAGTLRALIAPEREGKTWRALPGEAPKQWDLLMVYVDDALDAPIAEMLTDEGEDDSWEEDDPSEEVSQAKSVGAFEKRTSRVIDAVKGKYGEKFAQTPVRLIVLRSVDTGNRKIVFSDSLTVASLENAANAWAQGETNVPPWLRMLVLSKSAGKPVPLRPPHLAPLSVISFSKQQFLRVGQERHEVGGMPASEVLRFFLGGNRDLTIRMLRRILRFRADLVSSSAHALRRGMDFAKKYDRFEALRTASVLGVILLKSGREKEVYMKDLAFKLGQLLAAADTVHAGYCADVRGGQTPPSLLGNQVFNMALANPVKALATLSRRWKPYGGWVAKVSRERNRMDEMVAKGSPKDKERGWAIRKAVQHARFVRGGLADEIVKTLATVSVDDAFKAELLLGYMAGLPKAEKSDGQDSGIETSE